MNRRITLSAIFASLLCAGIALHGGNATAQTAKGVAGTYTVVSTGAYGDNPRGQLILGRDGRYSLMLARATLPKVAANARDKGTPEENKAIVGGSLAHFGKYAVDAKDNSITFTIETSTFPNWDGTTQKRPFKLSGDTLTYTVPARSLGSGAAELVWKRVK